MYDLPSDYPEDPGLPDQFHLLQPELLEATFQPTTYPPEEVFTAIDLNVYYDPDHLNGYKRPDWFAALGVEEICNEEGLRLSYVVWQEAAAPYLVVELLSLGKEQEDLGTAVRDAQQPPNKWQVYEQWLRVPYYVVFSRFTDELHYFYWQDGRYHEIKPVGQRLWLPEAGIGLGLWYGIYRRRERHWLRFYDADGRWIPTPLEQQAQRAEQERQQTRQAEQRAEQERQRAAQERQRAEQAQQQTKQERLRAERLAAKLKALGIEPDE
jgi:Uma2 family endonuclease